MKIKYSKKNILLILIILFALIIIPNSVLAVGLQANKGGSSLVDGNMDQKFNLIRKMEDEHGTLGTQELEEGNGIDCHMVKSTEWGTVAMLTKSRYGSDPIGQSNLEETTTGNKSGIYQMVDDVGEVTRSWKRAYDEEKKYYLTYWYNLHTGDGFSEFSISNPSGYINYGKNSLFGVFNSDGSDVIRPTRAIVVCGQGF